MAERRIEPSDVRERVLEQLARLPRDEHLQALHAIDAGDIELDLTAPTVVGVEVAGRWRFEVPLTGPP